MTSFSEPETVTLSKDIHWQITQCHQPLSLTSFNKSLTNSQWNILCITVVFIREPAVSGDTEKPWAAAVEFVSVLPTGNHRAHKNPITYFTGGQENSQRSKGERWNNSSMVKLKPRCCQQMNSDALGSASPESFAAATHGHGIYARRGRKAINKNWEICSTSG